MFINDQKSDFSLSIMIWLEYCEETYSQGILKM